MSVTLDLLLDNFSVGYAKDIVGGLKGMIDADGPLSEKQKHLVMLAVAAAIGRTRIVEATEASVASSLQEQEMNAARQAALVVTMHNAYYRFIDAVKDRSYSSMSHCLCVDAMNNYCGIGKDDFLLCALAVSVLDNATFCIDQHEVSLRELEVSPEQVQMVVKIAALMKAFARLIP